MERMQGESIIAYQGRLMAQHALITSAVIAQVDKLKEIEAINARIEAGEYIEETLEDNKTVEAEEANMFSNILSKLDEID